MIGAGGDGEVAELKAGVDRSDGFVGGAATVEVKGIPESLVQRATESVAVEEPAATEESMKEKVERIIDGEEEVVMVPEENRNPKSRRMEYDPQEEQRAQEDRNPKSRRMEYDPVEEQEGTAVETETVETVEPVSVHDEL